MNKSVRNALAVAAVLLLAITLHTFNLFDKVYDVLELEVGEDENFVAFLDVGQGDCTLIHSDGEYILIDSGCYYDDGITLTKKLLSYGVTELDHVIISHDHTDHAGGAYSILSEFVVGNIICPNGAFRGDDDFTQKLLAKAEESETELVSAVVGDSIKLADAVIDFLWLDERINENDSCLVVMLTLDGKRFFFGGDITSSVEKRMVNAGVDVRCDVYKASHHGSAGSSSELFLDAASPDYCVAMCSEDNRYGFPSESFLSRISARDIKLYTTAEHGDVVFDTTQNEIKTKK